MKKLALLLLVFCFQTMGFAAQPAAETPWVAPESLALVGSNVRLALEAYAPERVITGVRLDNIGGQSSLWRSDGLQSEALPIRVRRNGTQLADGSARMELALSTATQILDLSLDDNGAFRGGKTQFRVTVFLADGGRLLCLLDPADFLPRPSGGVKTPADAAHLPDDSPPPDAPPTRQPPAIDPPQPSLDKPSSPQEPAGKAAQKPSDGEGTQKPSDDKDAQDSKDSSSPEDPSVPGGGRDAVGKGPEHPDDWAYRSFQLLMNKAFGQGNWNDQGHSFDAASTTLSVNAIAMHGNTIGGTRYPSGTMDGVQVTAIMRPERLLDLLSGGDRQGLDTAPLAERLFVKNMLLEPERKDDRLSMASLRLSDVYLSGKAGDLTIEGFAFRARDNGAMVTLDVGLLHLVNPDVRELVNRGTALAGSKGGTQTFDTLLGELFDYTSLGSLFVSSFSLDQGSLKDAKLHDGVLTIRLAGGRADGPLRAGKIPPKFAVSLVGLAVDLPTQRQAATKELYELRKILGMSTVVMDIETVNSYDESTATLTRDLIRMNFRDLFDWSMRVRINGMTPQRLEALRRTRIKDTVRTLLNPDSELARLALEDFSFRFVDRSLFDRLYAYAKITKQRAGAMGRRAMTQYGSNFLANLTQITQALAAFLNDPGTLGFSVKPSPPLSSLSASKMPDLKTLLNSLNAVLIVNDKSSQPIVFKQPPTSGKR